MATTGRGIVYPTTANAITPLATHFANLATSADTAIGDGITASLITGTTTARNTKYGTPANDAQRVALANQKVAWFNTDLGWWESYYATTGLAGLTVTGLVSGSASGWYPLSAGPAIFLVPSASQSLSSGATFTNWTAPGTGPSWRRGGTSFFTYSAGVVTVVQPGRYQITLWLMAGVGSGSFPAYVIKNNSAVGPNVLSQDTTVLGGTYGTKNSHTVPSVALAASDNIRWQLSAGTGITIAPGADGANYSTGQLLVEYIGPNLVSN